MATPSFMRRFDRDSSAAGVGGFAVMRSCGQRHRRLRWSVDGDRRRGACRDDGLGRGMKGGRDLDIGQSELLIGTLDRRLDFRRCRLLRQCGDDLLDRDLARLPDGDLRHGDLLRERDGVLNVGLDKRLRAGLGLRYLTESRLAGRWFALRSRGMGAGAGGGSVNARRCTHLVGNIQIQLPNGKAISCDSGERGPVGDGEPHHGDATGVKNDGGRNRGGPRALIGPLIEKRNRVRRRH